MLSKSLPVNSVSHQHPAIALCGLGPDHATGGARPLPNENDAGDGDGDEGLVDTALGGVRPWNMVFAPAASSHGRAASAASVRWRISKSSSAPASVDETSQGRPR